MYRKIMKKYLVSLLLVTMTAVSLPMPVQAADNVASKMQMAKAEGSVEIAHSSGKTVSLRDNMKLYNGYQVDTLEKSYAWIELDGTKLAKLDAVSEAIIRKKGKQLEILLKSGNIFFNVSEPLKDDETLNIRTSTMVTGVRGTSGWLEVVDGGNVKVSILEGTVEVNVSNPLTGEVKNDKVMSGETAVCAVNQPSGGASGEGGQFAIQRESYKREEIGGFVLQEVFSDAALAEKIVEKGGLDLRDLTKEEVDTRLKADEETVHTKMVEVETALETQVANISTESVWVNTEEPVQPEPTVVAENTNTNEQTAQTQRRQPEPVVEVPPVVVPPVVEPPVVEKPPVVETPAPAPAPQQPASQPSAPATQPETPQPESWKVGVSGNEASVIASYDNGTLTISGSGKMRDYTNSDTKPWNDKRNDIKTIKIAGSVTHIGNYAFFYLQSATTVDIASGTESIGQHAFAGGSYLKHLSIPSSITRIGEYAFGTTADNNPPLEIWFDGNATDWQNLKTTNSSIIDSYTNVKVHWEYPYNPSHSCQSKGCSETVSPNNPG